MAAINTIEDLIQLLDDDTRWFEAAVYAIGDLRADRIA